MLVAAVRAVVAWGVVTTAVVFGVDTAIERVARDVAVTRPAPLTPGQVDQELRERAEATSTTSTPSGKPAGQTETTSPTTTVPSPALGPPVTSNGPEAPHGSEVNKPEPPASSPTGRSTTTIADRGPTPGHPDTGDEPGGP